MIGVERGLLGPAEEAVPVTDADRAVPELPERAGGLAGQRLVDLDGEDPVGQAGQDGGLIPGARPDLEDLVSGLERQALGHEGHDEGLGDRLASPMGRG